MKTLFLIHLLSSQSTFTEVSFAPIGNFFEILPNKLQTQAHSHILVFNINTTIYGAANKIVLAMPYSDSEPTATVVCSKSLNT